MKDKNSQSLIIIAALAAIAFCPACGSNGQNLTPGTTTATETLTQSVIEASTVTDTSVDVTSDTHELNDMDCVVIRETIITVQPFDCDPYLHRAVTYYLNPLKVNERNFRVIAKLLYNETRNDAKKDIYYTTIRIYRDKYFAQEDSIVGGSLQFDNSNLQQNKALVGYFERIAQVRGVRMRDHNVHYWFDTHGFTGGPEQIHVDEYDTGGVYYNHVETERF